MDMTVLIGIATFIGFLMSKLMKGGAVDFNYLLVAVGSSVLGPILLGMMFPHFHVAGAIMPSVCAGLGALAYDAMRRAAAA